MNSDIQPLQTELQWTEGTPEGRLYGDPGVVWIDRLSGQWYRKTTRRELNTGWMAMGSGGGGSSYFNKVGSAFVGGDQSGNARGPGALDVQSYRFSADQVAYGPYSAAFGNSNEAAGMESNAIGNYNWAGGSRSSAQGYANHAFADGSSAFGYENIIGYQADSSLSKYGSAFGYRNVVTGYKASAVGFRNYAKGSYSSGVGYNNQGHDRYSTAFGCNNFITSLYGMGFGGGNYVTGGSANAFGYFNQSYSNTSSAFGYANKAGASIADPTLGVKSSAFGYGNTASGDYSSAFGSINTASGYKGSAFGYWNRINGEKSSGFGYSNTADGYASFSAGAYCYTGGNYSTAVGVTATASARMSSAFGAHSRCSTEQTTVITGPQIIQRTNALGPVDWFVGLCGVETILTTGEVDLTAVADYTLNIPNGAHFWVKEVFVVVTDYKTVTVQPTLQFGIVANASKYHGPAITTTLNQAFDMELYACTPNNGESNLVAGVTVGATAVTLKGRFGFKGIFIEDQL